MTAKLLVGWRAALREIEGYLASPDPERVEAGTKIIFAKFLTLVSLPPLLLLAGHFLRRGMPVEAGTMFYCAASNTAAYLLIWGKLRRNAEPREILRAFRLAALSFLVAWGAQHVQLVALGGHAEYAPWIVLYPYFALILLGRREAAVTTAAYAAAFAALLLGRGSGIPLPGPELVPLLGANVALAAFTGGAVQLLLAAVNRHALRSMAEVRRSLEASEARARRAGEDLARSRDAAEEANRAKSEFLARMSHEIRTPMNAILGMTELLLHSGLEPKQRARAETVGASGSALMRLLDDLLDFSRIEANRLGIARVPFDPAAVVFTAADLFRVPAERKGLAFSCAVEPGVPPLAVGDPHRIAQVLNNLVSNALRHTERGGVAVRLGPDPGGEAGMLRFEVRDTGCGIASEDQRRIFEDFTQAGSYATRKHGGAGLGLAIAHRLVGLMGGTIGVESAPGRGSTFFFTVAAPASRGEAVLPPPATPAAVPPRPRAAPADRRVLVAEDNAANQALARDMLELIGCRVDVVGDGKAAVAAAADARYALIFMDCQMPVMDGYESTGRIREAEAARNGRRVPIVALTGHAMSGERERCLQAGMDDHLAKPFGIAQLREMLERWAPAEGGRAGP